MNHKPVWIAKEESRLNTQEQNQLSQQISRLQSINTDLRDACQLALKAIYSGQNYHDGGRLPNDAVTVLEAVLKKAAVI